MDAQEELRKLAKQASALTFLNVLWFEHLREALEAAGMLDDVVTDFINNAKNENRGLFKDANAMIKATE